MGNPTIKDVAAAAKVSVKTVSRIINNEPNVRADKKARVQAVIKELKYRPSQVARRLKSKRSGVLGLLYNNLSHSYVLDLLEGALARADQEHFDLLIRPCDMNNLEFMTQVSQFLDHVEPDGLLLVPPLTDHEEIKTLVEDRNLPSALISPRKNSESICVICDEHLAAVELTEHLISLGHKEIVFIKGVPNHGASSWRFDGFKTAMTHAGLRIHAETIQYGNFFFESGEKIGRKVLNLDPRPTAIIASNDFMAAGVYRAAQQLAIGIPDDLSVVGFDDAPIARQLWPPMTTVRQPAAELANRATGLLIKWILGENSEDDGTPLQCELIVRNSTAPPSG